MHPVLNRNLYLVKEHVGVFKVKGNYDVFDPDTGAEILRCREERIGMLTKILRLTDYGTMAPFHVDVETPEGEQVLSVKRGFSVMRSRVDVLNESDERVGGFKQKLLSIGGAFRVLGEDDRELCQLKGKWTGWDFRFEADGVPLARVSKKWAGIGREMFTSADNYVLHIEDSVPPDNPIRTLIFAAVISIDKVLKE